MPEEQKKEELHVPYAAYKDTVSAQERHVGRLIYVIVLIVVFFILAMLGEAGLFIWYLNQYEVVQETVTVDSTDGVANYIGRDGDISNGQNAGENSRTDQSDQANVEEKEE
jgi:hypothetical protein